MELLPFREGMQATGSDDKGSAMHSIEVTDTVLRVIEAF